MATVGGLTVAGGLFGLALTWLICLVKYGYVVDLPGVMLNLAAGSVSVCSVLRNKVLTKWKLLAVEVKWTKEGCPTQDKREEGYNGPTEAACGESKLDWLIGDKCENMGMRCRFSRVASVFSFIIVAMLLATLAFGGFGKKGPGLSAAKVRAMADDLLAAECLTNGRGKSVQMVMLK